jgi:hypothetical protein
MHYRLNGSTPLLFNWRQNTAVKGKGGTRGKERQLLKEILKKIIRREET